MRSLRRLYLTHRRWAMLVLGLALAIRLLVPAGFMPMMEPGKTLTLAMCNGMEPITIPMPMKAGHAMAGDHHIDAGHPMTGGNHEKNDEAGHHPCAFSGLSAPSLAATDPALLATALAFAVVFALLALPLPPLRRARHLRPPLRGPPLIL